MTGLSWASYTPLFAHVVSFGGCLGQAQDGIRMTLPAQPQQSATRCCAETLFSASQAANLTEEQFTELWQGYIDTAATCLLQANNNAESPAGQTLVSSISIQPYWRGNFCQASGLARTLGLQKCTKTCTPACASAS